MKLLPTQMMRQRSSQKKNWRKLHDITKVSNLKMSMILKIKMRPQQQECRAAFYPLLTKLEQPVEF